jgi:hypothetical protein
VSSLISEFLGWGADWIQTYWLLTVIMIILSFLSAGILTAILFWFLEKIYKKNRQIELLDVAYCKLKKDYADLEKDYEEKTHIKNLSCQIKCTSSCKASLGITKFLKCEEIQNLNHIELYKLYKEISGK